jgi:HPt (histidine-containing phosphotransfer) domain-containing protein
VSAHRRQPGARVACAGPLPSAGALARDPEFRMLVAVFVETLRARADALEAALVGADLAEVSAIAHQLRGCAKTYGFPAITDEAAAVERSARSGGLDEVRPRVDTLVGLCRGAREIAAFATH